LTTGADEQQPDNRHRKSPSCDGSITGSYELTVFCKAEERNYHCSMYQRNLFHARLKSHVDES